MHLSLNDYLSFHTFYFIIELFFYQCGHVLENQRVEEASDQNGAYKSFELTFEVHFSVSSPSFILCLSVYSLHEMSTV